MNARAVTPYQQLWGVVSGAVEDAFNRHPDYLTSKGKKSAATSIIKRVTGTVLSFAVQAAGAASAAESGQGALSVQPEADGDAVVIRLHSYDHVNERCYQAVRRALFPVGTRELRRDAKRFKSACRAKAERLRSELAADANLSLAEAVELSRAPLTEKQKGGR